MTRIRLVDPRRDFSSLQDRVNSLFDETFRGLSTQSYQDLETSDWTPSVDISQDEKQFVFEVDLPGFDKKDINVDVRDSSLTISGEKKFDEKVQNENYIRVERNYGKFSRSFTLPNTADQSKIDASYKNGVLKVTVAKKEEATPKKIDVKVS
ncbi:MAG TPA: Hsp20/alpha crystallin family protein [Thermodesulfobacteriota bacterium]|nr:Hsp20/alpha crystallin family protein [Thermodesulfobacteriota bacterium]